MLINLWVKDKSNGFIHQVGTDVHDSVVFLCGQVTYYNLQNGCGTPDEYEWVDVPDIDGYVAVTPEQLWLNRELVHKDLLAMLKKGGEGITEIERLNELSNLAPIEILNDFRNRYYNDSSNTENGIVANAINEILPKLCNEKKKF